MEQDKLVLSQHGINVVIDTTLENLPLVPRMYSAIMEYVLRGFNVFTLTLLKKLEDIPIKNSKTMKKIAVSCLASYETRNQVINGKYYKQIAEGLVNYWLPEADDKNECVLSYYENCLLVSGVIAFFSAYEKIPNKQKRLKDIQKNIKKILKNDIRETGVANIKNITGCLPNWFFVPLMMAVDICVYQYGQLNLHPELNILFDDFNKKLGIDSYNKSDDDQTIRKLSSHANVIINRVLASSF